MTKIKTNYRYLIDRIKIQNEDFMPEQSLSVKKKKKKKKEAKKGGRVKPIGDQS